MPSGSKPITLDTFVAWGSSPQAQCMCGLFFSPLLSMGLLTNSESLLGVEGREPDGLKKNKQTKINNAYYKNIAKTKITTMH